MLADTRVHRAEAKHDGRDCNRNRSEHNLCNVAAIRSFELAEQDAAPEKADKRVRIPQGEGDGETYIANSEDGKCVALRPEDSGEKGPDNQVLFFSEIREYVCGSLQQSGKRPAREEYAANHCRRYRERRISRGDELRRGFCRAQPNRGNQRADDAEAVQ